MFQNNVFDVNRRSLDSISINEVIKIEATSLSYSTEKSTFASLVMYVGNGNDSTIYIKLLCPIR